MAQHPVTLPVRMVPISVAEEVRQRLKVLAALHNISMGEMIRLLLDEQEEQKARP